MTERTAESVERALHDELARGDSVIAQARPILRHLLANHDHALLSEETVARVRGMMSDVARRLLSAQAEAAELGDPAEILARQQDDLEQALIEDAALLGHIHALALEGQLTERLQAESGIDAVLPPLVQDLAAGEDASTAGLSMAVLAAQARFMQHHRRMELPLGELPGDLFHRALLGLRSHAEDGDPAAEEAERRLRSTYEENAGRLAVLSRLVMRLDPAAGALAIEHAGLGVFATALGMAAGQARELTVFSFADGQFSRLALALRAADLDQRAVEQQFLILHPEIALPAEFEMLHSDRAAALLAASQPEAAL